MVFEALKDGDKIQVDSLKEAMKGFRDKTFKFLNEETVTGALVLIVDDEGIRTVGCIKPIDVARGIIRLLDDEDVAKKVALLINLRKIESAVGIDNLKEALKMVNELMINQGRPDDEDSK